MDSSEITIVFALYPGVTQLDSPAHTKCSRGSPGAEVVVASMEDGVLETTDGIIFAAIPAC